jgi:hypothetical protein
MEVPNQQLSYILKSTLDNTETRFSSSDTVPEYEVIL